jgi:hypothetical protein
MKCRRSSRRPGPNSTLGQITRKWINLIRMRAPCKFQISRPAGTKENEGNHRTQTEESDFFQTRFVHEGFGSMEKIK